MFLAILMSVLIFFVFMRFFIMSVPVILCMCMAAAGSIASLSVKNVAADSPCRVVSDVAPQPCKGGPRLAA